MKWSPPVYHNRTFIYKTICFLFLRLSGGCCFCYCCCSSRLFFVSDTNDIVQRCWRWQSTEIGEFLLCVCRMNYYRRNRLHPHLLLRISFTCFRRLANMTTNFILFDPYHPFPLFFSSQFVTHFDDDVCLRLTLCIDDARDDFDCDYGNVDLGPRNYSIHYHHRPPSLMPSTKPISASI